MQDILDEVLAKTGEKNVTIHEIFHPNPRFISLASDTTHRDIIYSPAVKKLPREEQLAAVAHEVAHIVYQHERSTWRNEIEADAYAKAHGFNIESLLKRLASIEMELDPLTYLLGSPSHPPMHERLRMINALVVTIEGEK